MIRSQHGSLRANVIPSPPISRAHWRRDGAAALALAAALLCPSLSQAADAVGQVSLLIGSAKVFHKDGSVSVLKQGAAIVVGDRIETAANGHVHVRFIDNAAFSVRPDSVMEVQAYQYDAARPQSNEVRLKVANGVGRSISGLATEADKSRFRLNTPIAAIGVRGTDFIVQAGADQSRVSVASGAIVMSPLGNGCLAEALGPCSGRSASLLSADMGKMMVEMRAGDRTPRVVPAISAVLAVNGPASDMRGAGQAVVAAAMAHSSDPRNFSNDIAAAQVLVYAPLGPFDAGKLNTPVDANTQLVWGRWSTSSGLDNISLPYVTAAQGRSPAGVGDGDASLLRKGDEALAAASLASTNPGKLDFYLTRGQAQFEIAGRTEAASLDGGTLTLNFANRSFATALAMSSQTAGKAELRAAGSVSSTGQFRVVDSDQFVWGAISADTKEAGYTFFRNAGGGLFRGRTLWGR